MFLRDFVQSQADIVANVIGSQIDYIGKALCYAQLLRERPEDTVLTEQKNIDTLDDLGVWLIEVGGYAKQRTVGC